MPRALVATGLLSGGSRGSVVVLDTDVNNDRYTLVGLSADTNYTLLVAALSLAGQSQYTLIASVLTTSAVSVLAVWKITLVFIAMLLPAALALVGVRACFR